jgi:hypothetical protein
MRNPAEIFVRFESALYEFADRPIPHRCKRTLSFLDGFDRLVPRKCRVIAVLVFQQLAVQRGRFLHLRIVETHFPAEEVFPTLRADYTE